MNNIKQDVYLAYLTQQDGDTYEGGLDVLYFELIRTENYRIQPAAHKEVYMYFGEDADRPDKF